MKQRESDYYTKVMKRRYQPSKEDLNKDVSIPVSPERLAQAVMKGGSERKKSAVSEDEES